MRESSIRIAIFAGIGAIAMMVPATASPTVSGSIDVRPAHAATTQQYAQDFSHGSGPVDYGYKSKKCKKSDKKCKTKTKPKSDKDKDKG